MGISNSVCWCGGNDLDAVHKQRKFIKNVDLECLV